MKKVSSSLSSSQKLKTKGTSKSTWMDGKKEIDVRRYILT